MTFKTGQDTHFEYQWVRSRGYQKGGDNSHSAQVLTSKKGSIWSIRAWVLLMINWLTQAIAWDLQRKKISIGKIKIFELWKKVGWEGEKNTNYIEEKNRILTDTLQIKSNIAPPNTKLCNICKHLRSYAWETRHRFNMVRIQSYQSGTLMVNIASAALIFKTFFLTKLMKNCFKQDITKLLWCYWPDFGTMMLEIIKKFWYEDIERPVEDFAVQKISRVFANLLQSTKSTLFGREMEKEEG